jgi:very-short-patch-repair endonuclease
VVSREQLLGEGVAAYAIDAGVAKWRLRVLFRGVYAIGHTAIRREGWWLAALLACGVDAALAGRSAGQYWRYAGGSLFPITVAAPTEAGRARKRIHLRRAVLGPSESTRAGPLRVTTAARTLIDLHATLAPHRRRELIERAQDLRRFDPAALHRCLDLHPRQPGRRPLLDFLALLEPRGDGTRSHLERLFLPLARRARIGRPLVNERVEGRRRDFVWPDRRLVVEVDGHAFHSSRAAIRRDKARDRELIAARWVPVRFTYEDVAFEPAAVVAELRKIATVGSPMRSEPHTSRGV